MKLRDDPLFHLESGMEIAWRLWEEPNPLTLDEMRELGREQIQNPVPGHNPQVRLLEIKHPDLRRKEGSSQRRRA